MKRQFILFLMTLITLISYAYDFEVDGIYYNRNYDWSSAEPQYDGTVSVTQGNGSYRGDLVIPDVVTYDGVDYKVTGIDYYQDYYASYNNCFGDIQSVVVGNNITYIPSSAFSYCQLLHTVVLPNTLKTIGSKAFECCSNLVNINMPESLERIEDTAFGGCKELTSMIIPKNVNYLGRSAFESCEKLSKVVLPPQIKKLPQALFSCCYNLKTIILPSALEEIGNLCFQNCTSINEIELPSTLKKIDDEAFRRCLNLTYIKIPESIDVINEASFSFCSSLSQVDLPSKLSKIGNYSFYECHSLISLVIPNSVYVIGEYAFENTGLTSIDLPEALEGISSYSFNCPNLKKVTIHDKVKSIYAGAFSGSVEDIFIYSDNPPTLLENGFINYDATVYVPEGKISIYKNASYWSKFNNIQEINGAIKKYFINTKYNTGGSVELNEEAIASGNVKDFAEGSTVSVKISPLENYVIRSVVLT